MGSSLYSMLVFINHHAGILALSVILGTLTLLAFKSRHQKSALPSNIPPKQGPRVLPSISSMREPTLELPSNANTNKTASSSPYPHKVFYSCIKKKKPANRHTVDLLIPMMRDNESGNQNVRADMHMPLTPSVPKFDVDDKSSNDNTRDAHRDTVRLSSRLQCIREYDEVGGGVGDGDGDVQPLQPPPPRQPHNNKQPSISSQKPPPPPQHPQPAASCAAMDPVCNIRNHELDATHYPQYLDGYTALNGDQKSFLCAIKRGDLRGVQQLCRQNANIRGNINFGDCQVIRECALENRLPILQFLKQTFPAEIDLNCESGYCLRWSSRKGFIEIVRWLLYDQKFEKIDISPFQYQAIEWSVLYKHKQIAKLLQKYYNEYRLNEKWNILGTSQRNVSVEWDIFNLPSIYQDIVERIINADQNNSDDNVNVIKDYYFNGCDLKFANCMPWTVAVDCTNIPILHFLYKTVGVDPLCLDKYLLRTACDIRSIALLQFAKSVINWELWKAKIEANMDEYKKLCNEDATFVKELENYHQCVTPIKQKKFRNSELEQPQSPIPWPYESPYVQQKYGILTRSKKKILTTIGVLEPMHV